MEVKIKKTHKDAVIPYKTHEEDYCYDCVAVSEEEVAASKEKEEVSEPSAYEAANVASKSKKKKEKAKMSVFTAIRLSARNLISKKGRTAMVGFAGSIGAMCLVGQYIIDSKENINSLAIFFTKPHSEYGKYLDDYDAVSDALTEKYGKPLISDVEWSSSLFQDSEDMHGTALAMGYLKKYAMWIFKDGTIYHSISGDNFEVEHSILYSSSLSAPSSKPVDLGI